MCNQKQKNENQSAPKTAAPSQGGCCGPDTKKEPTPASSSEKGDCCAPAEKPSQPEKKSGCCG